MKKSLKFLALSLSIISISLVASCTSGEANSLNSLVASADQLNYTTKTFNGYVLNTTYNASISADFKNDSSLNNKVDLLSKDVANFISELESSISTSVKTSSVYKFNQAALGETVEIDETTYTVLSLAKEMYEFTEGYYNPAVYYSVDLYSFAPREKGVSMPYDRVDEEGKITSLILPKEEYVTAFKQLATHFKDLTVEELDGKYYATKPQNAFVEVDGVTYTLKIDLGGIGKGYAVDIVEDMFAEYGFNYGYFSFGSSSLFAKKYFNSQDQAYNLGMTDPRGGMFGGSYVQVKAKDVSISTSGDYEKYYFIDNVRYSHLINPYTGSPIQTGIMSATVLGRTAAEGDALTTALCAMGIEKAIDFVNKNLKDCKVVIAYDAITEGQIIASFNDFTVVNPVYKVRSSLDENGEIIYPTDENTPPGDGNSNGSGEETPGDGNSNDNKKGCKSSIVAGESALIISLTLLIIGCSILIKGKKCH